MLTVLSGVPLAVDQQVAGVDTPEREPVATLMTCRSHLGVDAGGCLDVGGAVGLNS